ncbi:MAG: peptidoglycan-associated lipoprotein, partial [Myxococcota bacterium]
MFRNSMTKERVTVAMVALFLAVAGCQSTGNQGVETTGMETETLPEAGRVEGSELETMAQLEAVGFDTDRSALREDARLTLAAHAGAIQAHPEWGVLTVEGHCDERGSHEY